MVCNMCPRKCGIDRSEKSGYCGMTDKIRIARAELHFWEEPCISGEKAQELCSFQAVPLNVFTVRTVTSAKTVSGRK